MKTLSFITPLYNTKWNIFKETIDSFMLLKNVDVEMIIVDDKSTNGVYEEAKKYIKDLENVKLFQVSKNTRRYGACLKGISNSEGEYIHFLDSDDLLHTKKTIKFIKYLSTKKNKSDFYRLLHYKYNSKTGRKRYRIPYFFKSRNIGLNSFYAFNAMNTCYRRETLKGIEKIGKFEAPHDDSIIPIYAFSNSNKSTYLNRRFFMYRFNQSDQTWSGVEPILKNFESHQKIIEFMFSKEYRRFSSWQTLRALCKMHIIAAEKLNKFEETASFFKENFTQHELNLFLKFLKRRKVKSRKNEIWKNK